MKKKTTLILIIVTTLVLLLFALAFLGVRFNLFGLRPVLGYQRIEVRTLVTTGEESSVGDEDTYIFYTRQKTLLGLLNTRRIDGDADDSGTLTRLSGVNVSDFKNAYTVMQAVKYRADGTPEHIKEIGADEALDEQYVYILRLVKSSDDIQIGG